MKFTQEDLLNAMGLKVGDTVCVYIENFQAPIIGVVQKSDFNDEFDFIGAGVFDLHEAISLDEIITDGLEYSVITPPKYTLTETEKHIVLAIDEDFKWIARSSYGNLFVYVSKPTKQDDALFRNALDYCGFYPFNHLFQFIQWSDTEPVSLDELRQIAKGETK